MANQLKSNKEILTDTEAPDEQVAGIAHNPPSMDDVPEGTLGQAIVRGYKLTNNTSEILRFESVSVEDGQTLVNELSCTSGHAGDGLETESNTGPALWGEGSFNDGVGIARMSKMAGYIQNNMPIGARGTLSDQEASDLLAYILSQDRSE